MSTSIVAVIWIKTGRWNVFTGLFAGLFTNTGYKNRFVYKTSISLYVCIYVQRRHPSKKNFLHWENIASDYIRW